ncbi:DUF1772-domain-containing protein [Westerdykella ornata]|uniref:DUF1772-domain-containing protein n=1 Tax=Westerdykella ornata TaxID=318751 RepID=A0A6A6J8C7_WESOR|nr:DUF1772-domain-containing protein [Westerdykella ornata]KAF2272821.1 DUF1772-domain-containing protein [Westerdykella ornata]
MASISIVTVPVLFDTVTQPLPLLTQWARLYHYGHMVMPAFCVAATSLFAYSALRNRVAASATNPKPWRIYASAAATTISMVPFTWIVMAPTNNRLFGLKELAGGKSSAADFAEVRGLIASWAWMHIARSVFPLVGAVLGLRGVLGELSM